MLIHNIGLMACRLKHSSAVLHLHSVNSGRMTRKQMKTLTLQRTNICNLQGFWLHFFYIS